VNKTDHLEDLKVDWMILKCILKEKGGMLRNGFVWISKETRGGLL